jgi:hypothetical protein
MQSWLGLSLAKPMGLCWRNLRFVQRRSVWCPTWLGAFCIVVLLVGPVAWWCTCGEAFLSLTRRLPPEVLVVEGWIGLDGIRAAGTEFEQHGYQYIVPVGGMTSDHWDKDSSSYADMAEEELVRSGIPKEKIIVAQATDTETQRTYESASAVWRALRARGVRPKTLNVFTFGPHARRSRLVFAKVLEPETKVGVISWIRSGHNARRWWQSSERAREMLTESAGYLYEALLNSRRASNSPSAGVSADFSEHSPLNSKGAAP